MSLPSSPSREVLPLIIDLLEAVDARPGIDPLDVSESLLLPLGTINAVAQWAMELGLLRRARADEPLTLSEHGALFVSDVERRAALYAELVGSHAALVEVMVHLAETPPASGEVKETGDAAPDPDLDAAPALEDAPPPERLVALVRPVLEGDRYDWETGQRRVTWAPYGLRQEVFARAVSRHLVDSMSSITIGLPAELVDYFELVQNADDFDEPAHSIFYPPVASSRIYRGIPLTPQILAIVRHDPLERAVYAVTTQPHLSLAAVLMWTADTIYGPGSVYMTADMWGVKFWYGERVLGDALTVIEELALELGVGLGAVVGERGDSAMLLEMLVGLEVLTRRKTRYVLASRFAKRLARFGEVGVLGDATFAETMSPVAAIMVRWLESLDGLVK